MDIEFGMSVMDKNNKRLGEVDHIVNDAWSGEPRKYMVRLDDDVSAVYFKPEHVAEVTRKGVKLNLADEEIERT
ncbi:MAG: hypothetical protein JXA51_04010 [Dehalococcoidales bacterium]|nr:hypothetical protein [Dehalococcoidales bacterium]